jgi:hypothetical protein
MSAPVASRRCAVTTRTKPDSGEVDRYAWRSAKASMPAGAERHAMPVKPPAGSCVRCQSPTPPGVSSNSNRNSPDRKAPARRGNGS